MTVEPESRSCTVEGGKMLPAGTGGPSAVCAAIKHAMAQTAPGVRYKVDVRVRSASSMSARITMMDGRVLPEQRIVVNDHTLTGKMVERFASDLAAQLVSAKI